MPIANSLKQVAGFTRLGGDYFWCEDIALIKEQEGFNPRNYERDDVAQHIRHLADSYKRGEDLGALEVVVIDGVVYVREGHCRRRGRLLAISEGADLGRIVVKELKGDEKESDFKILSSQNGLKLSPVERSMIYRRILNRGISIQELALRENMTEVSVRNCLAVYDMPIALKDSIESGVVTMTLALEIYKEYGTKAVDMIDSAVQIRKEEAEKSEARMRESAALGDLFDCMDIDTKVLSEPISAGNAVKVTKDTEADSTKKSGSSNVVPFARINDKPTPKTPKPAPIKLTRKDLIKKPKKRSEADVEMAFDLLKQIQKAAKSKLSELASDDESLPFMEESVKIDVDNLLLNDIFTLLNK